MRRPPSFAPVRRSVTVMIVVLSVAAGFVPGAAGVTLPGGGAPELLESWGMDKGLPQSSVTAVIQTRDHYLWVGTDGGLARFDGMKFTTFRATNTPGLVNHAVTKLFEDREGNLWIGTEGGLIRHRERRFESIGLEGLTIHALCEDEAGTLWIGSDAGLHFHRAGVLTRFRDPALPDNAAVRALGFADGRVWIGLEDRAGVLCLASETIARPEIAATISGEVFAVAEAPRGVVWLGTSQGLVRIEHGQAARFGPPDGLAGRHVSALHGDPSGTLWVASTALQRITDGDLKSLHTIRPSSIRAFHSLWPDREGNLWAGTPGDGLLCLRRASFQLIPLNAQRPVNGFRTVMQDPAGSLWLAQGSLGHLQIDRSREAERILPADEAGAGEVLAVYRTRAGDLWIGGREGLKLKRDNRTILYPEFAGMRTMFEDRRGRLWMGRQDGGMVRWENGTITPIALPRRVADCTPASFAESADGVVWAGTWQHGLLRIDGEEVRVFDREAGLPTSELRCVFVDREERLWVGSRGRGLGLLDGENWILPEWTPEVLDQQIHSFVEDDAGNLWMSSPRGVFKVYGRQLADAIRGNLPLAQLTVVNVTEGLRQELSDLACFPAACRDRDGQLWFATQRGLLHIDPTGPARAPLPPVVHLERLLVNGVRQPLAAAVTLPPGTQSLAIEYTGLNFTAPGRVRFRYRLGGPEANWTEADDRRTAHYPDLRPGSYRFEVAAANAGGAWSEPVAFTLLQRGYFYQQAWIWWAGGLMLLGGGLGAHRWRMATLERERRRLEAGIAERTRELRAAKERAESLEQAKGGFLESMSHEIRNPLNGIIGLVAMLREAPLDARERELAQSLGACAKALARVFDDVLNTARLEHGAVMVREAPFTLTALTDEVVALFRVLARQRGSEITVRREGEVPEHWVGDGEKIRSILGNFVSNALKYAPGSPVEILIQCDGADEFGAELTFNVTDRGDGIPPDEQERIFEKYVRGSTARAQRAPGAGLGLATCRLMAELLGGHVAVESPASAVSPEPAAPGATFFLRLRLKRDRRAHLEPAPAEVPAETGRALIVEDQPYNQIVVRRIAERLGFASDCAHHGADALACLERQAYAVVFLDWELPGIHGEELARRLRQTRGGRDALVIVTTAHDSDEIRAACRAAAIDGFALKPFETEAIARLIEDARTRRRGDAVHPGRLDTRVFRFVGYDDPEQAGQAARLYLDILDREVALLEGAMNRSDCVGTAAAAHRIKSHAGLVDAADLRATADRLQSEARTSPALALAGLQDELVRHAGELRQRLRTWQAEDEGG